MNSLIGNRLQVQPLPLLIKPKLHAFVSRPLPLPAFVPRPLTLPVIHGGVRGSTRLLVSTYSDAGGYEMLPDKVAKAMKRLYRDYEDAVLQNESKRNWITQDEASVLTSANMHMLLFYVLKDIKDPFEFGQFHTALSDYFNFGQDFFRPLIDFRCSFVGNHNIFKDIHRQLFEGDDVILISNQQTDVDSVISSLLLEYHHRPLLAENMVFVARDGLPTDTLCKPFSMGRNFLKMDKIVEHGTMPMAISSGGCFYCFAPTVTGDRPNHHKREWYPAPIDTAPLMEFVRLAKNCGRRVHVYPVAILCHDIMPNPLQIEKESEETRLVCSHGAGLSVGPSITYEDIVSAFANQEPTMIYTQLYASICKQYEVLHSAIHGQKGLYASTKEISLSQPWTET